MAYYQTKGLTLTRRDIGEDDRLFNIYTRDYGKIEALAKGGKKIKSKLVGHLEPFLLSEILVAKGKNCDQLAGSYCLYRFDNIWQDVFKIGLAGRCLALVDQLVKLGQPDRKIYELLVKTSHLLDKLENREQLLNLAKIFNWRLLNFLGYGPELYYCLACREKIVANGKKFFDADKGGLICGQCAKAGSLISDQAIKVLRWFSINDIIGFTRLKMSDELRAEINNIIDLFVKSL